MDEQVIPKTEEKTEEKITPDEEKGIVENAREERILMQKILLEMKAENVKKEKLMAEMILEGTGYAGIKNPKVEKTAKDYAKEVMAGKHNG